MLASITDALKAVNARLDEQNNATRKAFADQKLIIDTLSSDLRVVREKVDDNNVRISSLTQELDALRQAMQQMATRPSTTDAGAAGGAATAGAGPPDAGGAGATSPQPSAPGSSTPPAGPPPTLATSPQHLYEMAWSDYASGQWDLAIQGFESFIRTFPKSDQADDAQVNIGTSYMMAGNYPKAVEAYDKAIRDYPTGNAIPDAYYRRGLALRHLGQLDKARESLDYVVKNYPDSDAGRLARQQLDQMKRP
jgi:tol-pal system protein YbgF